MITFFTIPKAFHNHLNIIQKNSIKSWQQIVPESEIILFGDDDGVAEVAEELALRHVPLVDKNEFGTPLLNFAFSIAQEISSNDIIVYTNSDIIFLYDLNKAIKKIYHQFFLACGSRWDLDLNNEIDFSDPQWKECLLKRLKKWGSMHGPSGIDYFIFKRGTVNMPPFAVGRPGWDGWLIFEMRRRGIPVINTTEAITAIHQNHDYSHSNFGLKKRVGGPEMEENIRLAGGRTNMLTLRDADWVIAEHGLKRPSFSRRLYTTFSLFYPWRLFLGMKRNLQLLCERR